MIREKLRINITRMLPESDRASAKYSMAKKFREIKKEMVVGTRVSGVKTTNPVVMAMVGVTGAGLSTLARALKYVIGWDIIEKNKIRVMLREHGSGFKPRTTDEIHDAMLVKILKAGGNMILDSDFADRNKRKKLEHLARRYHARVLYLHIMCDRAKMLERIVHSRYNRKTDIFPDVITALAEHERRLMRHYRWSEAQGGRLTPRRFGMQFFAEIDTTHPAEWKNKIRMLGDRLQKM